MKIDIQNLPKDGPLAFEYQFYKTTIGNLLIVSWGGSLVSIAFAATKSSALDEIKKQFPKATFRKKETPAHTKFLKYLRAPIKYSGTFTLATNGSPFQIKIWQALLAIPFGETCFYSDLAKAIKKPTAVRAAASAVARNPVAVLIPCHRVLPRSGGVGNYHWGSKQKSSLLIWEGMTLANELL